MNPDPSLSSAGEVGVRTPRRVILGVAASDSHAVANHLITYALAARGFDPLNLGACTSVAEFAAACASNPDAVALLIGSLNGHIHEDLRDLPAAKAAGLITCPVIVGGNLSVGHEKQGSALARLAELGVDYVLDSVSELFPLLEQLGQCSRVREFAAAATTA